jgi:hypothetical protein
MTNISHDSEIIIVYIQPTAKESEKNIITFNNISEYLSDHVDDFTKRFILSLKKWINNPND